MSEQRLRDAPTRPPERELWVRNQRGLPPKPGPWHLVKRRAERTYGWSAAAECGFHPDYGHQRCDDRPRDGGFCRKCLAAAEARFVPAETDGGQRRTTCGAGQDGECWAHGCVQDLDGEPAATGRFCPLPIADPVQALREATEDGGQR